MPRRKETLLQTALRRAGAWALGGFSTVLATLPVVSSFDLVQLETLGATLLASLIGAAIAFIGRFAQVVSEGLARGEDKIG